MLSLGDWGGRVRRGVPGWQVVAFLSPLSKWGCVRPSFQVTAGREDRGLADKSICMSIPKSLGQSEMTTRTSRKLFLLLPPPNLSFLLRTVKT